MNERYVVASDLGSGGCKTVIADTSGHVLAVAQREYPTAYPRPGWVEQNPEDWYMAFCSTVRKTLNDSAINPSQVAGVGIVGVTHNTVLLDKNDRPLHPSILLFDTRSTDQVRQILKRWGDQVYQRTLNDITTVWSWPQLMWIRDHKPDIWSETCHLLFQKDYVRHRLAPSQVTDVIDAGGSLLFDPLREEWISEFCDDLRINPDWLPATISPMEVVSEIGHQGAEDTGLCAGTPVIVGTTDTVAEVLGSGAVRSGSACVKLASVGRIAVVANEPLRQPHILNYRHVFEGLWYPGTASKYAASAFRWLRDVMWPELSGSSAYKLMDEAAAKAPVGSGGLLFHPHLLGEWAPHWDEKMRGDFLGLTIRHTRDHLTRAVLEGVAFSLKDALSEMEASGLPASSIRLIGQGSKSDLWAQIMADVLNRSLVIPDQPDAAYGCALMTAMGIGLIPRQPETLETIIAARNHVEPDPQAASAYAELFHIYRDADRSINAISARLDDFEHQQQEKRESDNP